MSQEFDHVQKLENGTVLQHGKYNNRVYLIKKGDISACKLVDELLAIAEQNNYSKIFVKSSARDLPVFIDRGFTIEAIVPGYFKGEGELFMVCYYLNDERVLESDSKEYDSILNLAKIKSNSKSSDNDGGGTVNIRACQPDDIMQMVKIYRHVFSSYPFPIHDSEYLRQTMDEHVDYYCVEKEGQILALSSAEIDYVSKSAEMTDFATPPENRGRNYAAKLLSVMESMTAKKEIVTFYTIARAISPGMNITFARNGYMYGGRLKNNTNISGSIESMNVWYKHI